MLCQVCLRGYGLPVCRSCARELNPAPDRLLDGGLRVVGAFEHTGPATVLVHNLKYRGVSGYPRFVAELLAPRLPRLPVVPIPRATSRRVRYGVDPARLLAIELSRLLEVPVESVLAPVLHSRRRAGGDHSRSVAPFRVR